MARKDCANGSKRYPRITKTEQCKPKMCKVGGERDMFGFCRDKNGQESQASKTYQKKWAAAFKQPAKKSNRSKKAKSKKAKKTRRIIDDDDE